MVQDQVIKYYYNVLNTELEEEFSKDYNMLLDDRFRFREAIPVPISISADISFYPGYKQDIPFIVNTIKSWVDSKRIGEKLEVFDLIAYLQRKVRGIDNLTITRFSRKENNAQDIEILPSEIATIAIEDTSIKIV